MPALILSEGFHSAPEVGSAGRSLVAWVRMVSWWGQWAATDPHLCIPKSARRMFSATPGDIAVLIKAGLLADTGKGWIPLREGDLWRIATAPRTRIPDDLRALVYERDEFTCQLCGATDDLTLDHIIPWSHGGSDTITNLRVLCRSCNSSRGNRIEATA